MDERRQQGHCDWGPCEGIKPVAACIAAALSQSQGRIQQSKLTCEDDRKLWVKADSRDVVAVALQGLHTGLGLVVPHLGQLVICTTDQIRPVTCITVK